MLSLYIHIPFCAHKCSYCSFFVMPEDKVDGDKLETVKDDYLKALYTELTDRHEAHWTKQIKTIYIWWGTPFQLWAERLFGLIDSVLKQWDTEFLEELTIELNPDPIPEVIAFIEKAWEKYKNLFKLRFSIGIQTFDDQLLSKSKRNYHYNNLPGFFRAIQKIKQPNMAYSWDFIAFGKFKKDDQWTEYLWDIEKTEFFINLVKSKLFDWFSLYTLELFPWSDWHNEAMHTAKAAQKIYGSPENVLDEFHFLRKFFENYWYRRYEISNFALLWKESLHNLVYRTDWSYLWIWINASSYISDWTQRIRSKNTTKRNDYLSWNYKDDTTIEEISAKEHLWEQWLMQLRTSWIKDMKHFTPVLSDWWETMIGDWEKEGYCVLSEWWLHLTSLWMNVYNTLITELFTL